MPPKKAAAKTGYKLPPPFEKDEILEDLAKRKWKIGSSIGKGGFGEIYCAEDASGSSGGYNYVVKIEPHMNGPLFVEMHFYMKFGKQDQVEEFRKKHKLKTFGMPVYHGSGSHEYKNEKYRFLVLDRLGKDLWKLFEENKRQFSVDTVFKLGVQILYVLEYIHEKDYVHADIKAANLLFGTTKETSNQIYLLDFGLATKYNTDKEFKPNPKKAHDGTIEYLSRDAHKGVQTRRGDLEILAYNLIQWLGCTLPWEKIKNNPNEVHASKTKYMGDIPQFMKACFKSQTPPGALVKFLEYINTLKHDSNPDYKKIRDMFVTEIKKAGGALDKPFSEFIKSENKRLSLKRRSSSRISFSVKKSKIVPPQKVKKVQKKPVKKNKKETLLNESKKENLPEETADTPKENGDPYAGFTPEMRTIMEKKLLQKSKKKVPATKLPKKGKLNHTEAAVLNGEVVNSPQGYNDEMKAIHKKIIKKVKKITPQSPPISGVTIKRPQRNLRANSSSTKPVSNGT